MVEWNRRVCTVCVFILERCFCMHVFIFIISIPFLSKQSLLIYVYHILQSFKHRHSLSLSLSWQSSDTDTPTEASNPIISNSEVFAHLHKSFDLALSTLFVQGNEHFVVFRQQEPFTEVTSLKLLSLSHTFGSEHAGIFLFSIALR